MSKRHQAKNSRNCLWIIQFQSADRLYYIDWPCFVAFLKKNDGKNRNIKKKMKFIFHFDNLFLLISFVILYLLQLPQILTSFWAISIVQLFISDVWSCCRWIVKGETVLLSVEVGSHWLVWNTRPLLNITCSNSHYF